jgi:hypothetical protein
MDKGVAKGHVIAYRNEFLFFLLRDDQWIKEYFMTYDRIYMCVEKEI